MSHETQPKHVDGPWFIDEDYAGRTVIKASETDTAICQIYDTPLRNENARAIAAAPELLQALKGLLDDIDSGLLVRDVTRDGAPGWTTHMLAFVERLRRAQAAVLKAEEGR